MSHPKPTAVLFDLDGTLLDTAPDFFRILNQMRAEQQLSELNYPLIRREVSNGAAAMVRSAFGINHPLQAQLQQQLLEHYQHTPIQDSVLFDGIAELLEWLEHKQIRWGIVTNKPERYCRPILATLQLSDRCQTLICPDHVERGKPHPEGLLKACRELQVKPEHCCYVGDHRRDIEAGLNAGMHSIGARYGYLDPTDPPQNWNANLLIDSPAQLLNWLKTCA